MSHYFIGELLVDMIGDGSLAEADSFKKRAGGAPANAAVAASRLGAESHIVATVGNDEFGDFLVQRIESEGVNTDKVSRSDRKTTLAFVGLDSEGKPEFSFYRGADREIESEQLNMEYDFSDTLHIGSLPFTDKEVSEKLIELVKSTDAFVSFDPNLREELMGQEYLERLRTVVKNSDIVFLAEDELEYFGGKENLAEEVPELIVTRGKRGAELVSGGEEIRLKPPEVYAVDTTGAGDALTGAYLTFRSEGKEFALEKAVEASAQSIQEKGAMSSLPERNQLT